MKFRTLPETDIRVSEIGFGLWTISTGWWGNFTEGEAVALMHKALDLGITLFDAADTYGNGYSEELIARAFPKQRDQIVVATKTGSGAWVIANGVTLTDDPSTGAVTVSDSQTVDSAAPRFMRISASYTGN